MKNCESHQSILNSDTPLPSPEVDRIEVSRKSVISEEIHDVGIAVEEILISLSVKETEARLTACNLNKEQHRRSSLRECWWSTLIHIFKTFKVLVIKNVVYYISFWGKIPSMVFILKSDSHTCAFTWSLNDKHCKY